MTLLFRVISEILPCAQTRFLQKTNHIFCFVKWFSLVSFIILIVLMTLGFCLRCGLRIIKSVDICADGTEAWTVLASLLGAEHKPGRWHQTKPTAVVFVAMCLPFREEPVWGGWGRKPVSLKNVVDGAVTVTDFIVFVLECSLILCTDTGVPVAPCGAPKPDGYLEGKHLCCRLSY